MHLFILILGSMLLPKAYNLKCYQCGDGPGGKCTQQECSSSDQCGAVRVTSYMGNSKSVDVSRRSCYSSKDCINGSVNFGYSRTTMNTKCCSTELCNTQNAEELSAPSNNGKMCYGCTEKSGAMMCNNTINCMGDEDYCISTSVMLQNQKNVKKGCASKIMCSVEKMGAALKMLPGLDGLEISCCEGNMCNSAGSTGVGLLLLVVPMVSLPLFL